MSNKFANGSRLVLAVLSLAVLAGCGRSAGDGGVVQLADPGPAVETVNGQPVPQRLLDALARARNWDLSKPEFRERALKELTGLVLVAEAARDEKFASDPDFAAAVELSRLQGLSAASFAEFQKRAQVDDTVLRAEYDKQIAKSGGAEYDFSNMVFATEPEAIKAAGEVLAGKPFDQVLEEHKKDARQARSFNHVRVAQMPEPLAQALQSMKPGETTKVPVQTKFGWHVAHLTATTPYSPPPFDQVKDNLRRSLVKRAGDERVTKMREEAKIVLTDPPPPAAPLPPRPAGNPMRPDLMSRPVPPPQPPADASKPKN
jgi:peptidyl-prolyl cis-trans isomerase C